MLHEEQTLLAEATATKIANNVRVRLCELKHFALVEEQALLCSTADLDRCEPAVLPLCLHH